MPKRTSTTESNRVRIQLRSALAALIRALRTHPLDWPAANALATDVEHLYQSLPEGERSPGGAWERFRLHLATHQPFDQEAMAGELQLLHDSIPVHPG